MSATFYLFDVDHGQAAALRLPNGRWCAFDVGCTASFSPVCWTAGYATLAARALGAQASFRFLKATVSHLHGDHLADYDNLFKCGPDFLKTVDPDQGYLDDCYATCADVSARARIHTFLQRYGSGFSPATTLPDYGGVLVRELWLPVGVARGIGGDANARVNNASVVTRIDVYGNSILLCGDLEKEAWEVVLATDYGNALQRGLYGIDGNTWRALVSDVDILVAPHHGHASAYSTELLNLARPRVVLASVISKDPHVDGRYSQQPVRGIRIDQTDYSLITTRKQGHIKVEISPPEGLVSIGKRTWTFGDSALT